MLFNLKQGALNIVNKHREKILYILEGIKFYTLTFLELLAIGFLFSILYVLMSNK